TPIYYEDFGEGSPIVFVHGGAATHALWYHQVYELADRFRTVTYDHRGFGVSEKPRKGYTTDQLADDLYDLVNTLGLHDATLVSHGFGGHVVLRAAQRHPDIASKLILSAAAPWFSGNVSSEATSDDATLGGFSEDFAANLSTGIGTNYAGTNWDLFENWLFHRDPGIGTKVASLFMAQSCPSYVMKQLIRDLSNVDHRGYLDRITQPTLVLHGIHDRKNRYEGAKILSDLLP